MSHKTINMGNLQDYTNYLEGFHAKHHTGCPPGLSILIFSSPFWIQNKVDKIIIYNNISRTQWIEHIN